MISMKGMSKLSLTHLLWAICLRMFKGKSENVVTNKRFKKLANIEIHENISI